MASKAKRFSLDPELFFEYREQADRVTGVWERKRVLLQGVFSIHDTGLGYVVAIRPGHRYPVNIAHCSTLQEAITVLRKAVNLHKKLSASEKKRLAAEEAERKAKIGKVDYKLKSERLEQTLRDIGQVIARRSRAGWVYEVQQIINKALS